MGVTEYDWDSYNGYYSVSHASTVTQIPLIVELTLLLQDATVTY